VCAADARFVAITKLFVVADINVIIIIAVLSSLLKTAKCAQLSDYLSSYPCVDLFVSQWSHVLHSCFEWSVRQKPVSAQWSTSRVQLVRSYRLDMKWWKHCVCGLVIGLLRFLIALVSYTSLFICLSFSQSVVTTLQNHWRFYDAPPDPLVGQNSEAKLGGEKGAKMGMILRSMDAATNGHFVS